MTDEELRVWHGSVIKQLRVKKRMKQIEMAAAMGMSKQWANRFEQGTIELRISVALRFAEVFDVNPAIFLPKSTH